jgi:transcriptional regulator with XRE-family HTH domain
MISSIANNKQVLRGIPMANYDGDFLRKRRETLGLSQGDLALRLAYRKIKLSRHAISEWENGKRIPDLCKEEMALLAEALRWSVAELVDAMKAGGGS